MDFDLRAAWPGASWRRPRSSEMVKSLSEYQAKSRVLFISMWIFLLFLLLSENLMSETKKKKRKNIKATWKKEIYR
jgi:hypothetical protein